MNTMYSPLSWPIRDMEEKGKVPVGDKVLGFQGQNSLVISAPSLTASLSPTFSISLFLHTSHPLHPLLSAPSAPSLRPPQAPSSLAWMFVE